MQLQLDLTSAVSLALEAVLELNRTPEMELFTKIIDDFILVSLKSILDVGLGF